MYMYSDKEHVQ